MELGIERSGKQIRVTAGGNITTTQESMEFKKSLSEALLGIEGGEIDITVSDSFFLPSSIIGFLLQLVEIDKHTISLHAGRPELRESLKKLGLAQILGVKGV